VSIRAFLGIGLAPQVRTTLNTCTAAIQAESRAWRDEKWVAAENLHVTLKFLGTVEESDLGEIVDACTRGCQCIPQYSLTLGEIVAKPRLRTASMLWATLDEGESQTAALATAIEGALATVGVESTTRPFSAHITIARARKPKQVPFEALDAGNRALYAAGEREKKMSVRGITLFSSTLTPRGPLYQELAHVPFAG
jgi:2'-5' RNA ligase